ncbi:hypothetical protein PJF56_04115 [Roseofilum sp. BLCC_M91]|uniref:Hemerythrin-like domain-containing protein n=1 Tax=Roseofilum halophilum BLCC-M91 TaxID=3022259 RepID=A0ABT7BIE5_9CYAN|nr:hypothetical protein [Roseofilum halophilum]MDJ1178043.1 hypothetical protein [Roseofilum halophilum BLCC-M91]
MDKDLDPSVQPWEQELSATLERIKTLAALHQEDSVTLLAILRRLEQMHHHIRETWFQESLPDNRQTLYALLRDMETEGGWPYISRMQLQTLLKVWFQAEVNRNLPESLESEPLDEP